LVALHGFSQTGAAYEETAGLLGVEVVAPDLPGHGRSTAVPASFDSATSGTVEILRELGRPVPLLGYSQGGRVALGVALEHPDLVSRLILVSTSPGIASAGQRSKRRQEDESRATRLESIGIEKFLDEWLEMPMFGGLSKRGRDWQKRDRAVRLQNGTRGLAAALRGMGQGVQPYFGDRLGEIRIPALLIVGALDHRYVALAEAMRRGLRDVDLAIVPNTGHPVVGEEPGVVADLVGRFVGETH
jgi:2-succinyl-6-hydroxy-2,4-cyclohexadiene-1-carboxylate synthase